MHIARFERSIEILKNAEKQGLYFNYFDWEYCAAGHLARDTEFSEQGLYFLRIYCSTVVAYTGSKYFYGYYAMAAFLDISEKEAKMLFNPWLPNFRLIIPFFTPTLKSIIKKMEKMLSKQKAKLYKYQAIYMPVMPHTIELTAAYEKVKNVQHAQIEYV